jgi:hypothetical protein
VPSTEAEDDELDPHGSSRTIGGFIQGRAAGNNYNWGDANDATSMDSADQMPQLMAKSCYLLIGN